MSTQTVHIQTTSPDETEALGKTLAPFLTPGVIIALYGNLAAGKTCLVHGLANAFEVNETVNSPTFTIVNEYHGTQTLYHLDLYRLNTLEEIYDLGYEELFDNPDGICLIEWAERAGDLLPDSRVNIHMEHKGEDIRAITIDARTGLQDGWQEAVLERFPQEA